MVKPLERSLLAIACAVLAGCSQALGPLTSPRVPVTDGNSARPDAFGYRVVHNFGKGSDGSGPQASLLEVGGAFFGTTTLSQTNHAGGGTVFSVTANGSERVLHTFDVEGVAGGGPQAGLIDVHGTLYGTTPVGGTFYDRGAGGGAAFRISKAGAESIVHSFGGGKDGANPFASLLYANGTLYGTTQAGGTHAGSGSGDGTVFSLSTTGKERLLHSFSDAPDGAAPTANLIDVKGILYGTTVLGGAYNEKGCVFSITTGGKERVLHSFGSGSDGANPAAGLIEVGGSLYGTTINGGKFGYGTIFVLSQDGKERVLHSFGKGLDGKNPVAALIKVNGVFYGTTVSGGTIGLGTVFSIGVDGTSERVLHNFGKANDGSSPKSSLIEANGTLYGTTVFGGRYNSSGTVFALTP